MLMKRNIKKLIPPIKPRRCSLILTEHAQEFVNKWPISLYFIALKEYEKLFPNNKIISHKICN
jgi:hypothetical protein